jgi:hypothetical protein
MEGKLEARGRITEVVYDRCAPQVVVNELGKVDGARFASYDPDTETMTIRVDHSETPSFWLELSFTEKQLKEFVRKERESSR